MYGTEIMAKRIWKKASVAITILVANSAAIPVTSEEKIIQQEKMSFERCLKVIKVSEEKLSVPAAITDISDLERIAVFKLLDGLLTITCDGVNEKVTVATELD